MIYTGSISEGPSSANDALLDLIVLNHSICNASTNIEDITNQNYLVGHNHCICHN
jgi:hypothetical protein